MNLEPTRPYSFLGDPSISAIDQRNRLNFTHCDRPAEVMVDVQYKNVTTRCKCGVKVRMSFPKLVEVLTFLDTMELPHNIGLFLRADRAVARAV